MRRLQCSHARRRHSVSKILCLDIQCRQALTAKASNVVIHQFSCALCPAAKYGFSDHAHMYLKTASSINLIP